MSQEGQSGVLTLHEGGVSEAAAKWDGNAERALGTFILRLLQQRPPADSVIAADLRRWAQQLLLSGQARLAEAGQDALKLVG